MTKRPFSRKGQRVQACLELVQTDACEPPNVQTQGGFEYFITFTDDHSRYGYVYLMHHLFEAFEKIRQFKSQTKKRLGKNIKALQ